MPTDPIHEDAVQHPARLVATVPAPLGAAGADAPEVLHWPGRRLLVQHADDEVAVVDLGEEGEARQEFRFPAPWPRPFGRVTVSPGGDIAVFSGVHGVRAVDRGGDVLWEIQHGCWATAVCAWTRAPFPEYADDPRHHHADRGSAAFSADGKLVWAHVRHYSDNRADEEWLVVNAADGVVLGRAKTMTVGSGSLHFPHPSAEYMGLTVGEGDDDSPVLWGHWDGTTLAVERLEGEIFQAVSPSGRHFLCTDPGQWALYLHEATDGTELRQLDAREAVPPVPGDDMARWDYEGAYPYEEGAVVSTEEYAEVPRHWLVNPRSMSVRGLVTYPLPVAGSPRSAGAGMWHTVAKDKASVHLWCLADEG